MTTLALTVQRALGLTWRRVALWSMRRPPERQLSCWRWKTQASSCPLLAAGLSDTFTPSPCVLVCFVCIELLEKHIGPLC